MKSLSTQQTIFDRLFGWWYAIAAPSQVSEEAPLQDREAVRKARFTSIVLLTEIIYHVATLTNVIGNNIGPQAVVPLVIATLVLICGVLLNRLGKTRAAGIVVFVTVEVAMSLGLIATGLGEGGLSVLGLVRLPMLIQPTLIAISLFPIAVAVPVCIYNCLFIIALLTIFPKTPDVAHIFSIDAGEVYFQLISGIIVVSLVSLFWASSTLQEMKRANLAEEVNRLAHALADQQRTALQEKQQLEESIQQIIAVHMQVANGDLNARVPLDQKNVLWSIAGSLNNLLARVQRWRQEVQQAQHIDRAIQQTLYDIRLAKQQGTRFQPRKTGTSLDVLLFEMAGNASAMSSPHHQTQSIDGVNVSALELPPLPPYEQR